MAITSKGYAGTIDFADWAGITAHMGGTYSVFGVTSFAASAGAGDRQVVIAPGSAAGAGILDVSDSAVTLAGAVVASGSRWDLIVLRRNWSTKVTTLAIKTGGTIVGRDVGPGALDEQPLYLVRFAAGQTAVQEIIDLRVWRGDSGLFANDPQVREYMNRVGTTIRIGARIWSRIISGGAAVWFERTDRDLIGSDGVRWMIESGSGKVYLRDDTNDTWPWTILRDGTLASGKVPVARLTGVLPLSKGGLGADTVPLARKALGLGETDGPVPVENGGSGSSTRAGALANLGFRFIDTGTITVAAGQEASVSWTVPGFVGDWVIVPSSTNPLFTLVPFRAGTSVGVRVLNQTGEPRTGTVMAMIARRAN